ncbi:class C sortase [Microbacterium sp. LjRoot45]|uniref:class C sortase n=1 Tax=Microbacterium sp. LjRoot45 TaxID=3342329 RepID=UPI003ECEEDE2
MTSSVSTGRRARRERRRPSRLVPFLVAAIFVVGAVTLLYPTAAAWITQYQQSQIIAALSDEVDQLPAEGLGAALEAAHAYNARLTGEAVVGANANVPTAEAEEDAERPYGEQLVANSGGLMGRLKIPSISVDLPIYHGTSDLTLLRGVGHLEGTSLPVGGTSTHSVLTAHRGLASAELFTNLDRVEVGDTLTIEIFGETLTYRVRQTQVVEPTETETLRPVRGDDLVTLVTCTPLGINTQRILVTGERITPTPIEDVKAAGQVPDIPGFPWWAVLLGAVVLAAALYVWLAGRPRRRTADATKPPEPTPPEPTPHEPTSTEPTRTDADTGDTGSDSDDSRSDTGPATDTEVHALLRP